MITRSSTKTLARPEISDPSLTHIGVSIYRNAEESGNLRERIPQNILIKGYRFEGYSVAVHLVLALVEMSATT
jgi:hypothetical protein